MKKIIFLFAFIFALHTTIYAQNTAYFTFDFNGYVVNKMIKVSGNNYLGVLYFSQGKMLAKFDQNFNLLWCKHLSSMPSLDLLDLEESNNGNYYMLGGYADSSFLFKFSSTGTLMQSKYFTSSVINNFTPINITRSITGDGVLMSGGYCNTPNYMIRLDDNLNVVWKYSYANTLGTCIQSRSSDIVTETDHYTYMFNTTSGGVNLVTMNDNGDILQCKNFNLALQVTGFPIKFNKLINGGYVATWESINAANGTEYIFVDNNMLNARSKKYMLNNWNSLEDVYSYDNNKIIIGGITEIGTNQSNIYFAVDDIGNILWAKNSDGLVNPNSGEVIYSFVHGLDNTVYAFGGGGLDGPTGAKLDFNGNGFCTSNTQTASISSSDSVAASTETINRSILNTLTTGPYTLTTHDTSFTRTVKCGTLSNTPLDVASVNQENYTIYPNPCSNTLTIQLPSSGHWDIKIYDVVGRFSMETSILAQNNLYTIETFQLPIGQYILRISNGEEVKAIKFVKE